MYTQIQKGLPQMVLRVLVALGATVMSASVGHGALILALDQPIQFAAAGSIVEFTGTITNTGPETLGLIDVRFTTSVDPPPFEPGIPLVLLFFFITPANARTDSHAAERLLHRHRC
jgi:hypothetical protein